MQIVFATGNEGKLREARLLAEGSPLTILSPAECFEQWQALGLPQALAPIPDPEETGSTYHENSLIKAKAYSAWCGLPVIADDAGLEVVALEGAPGVYSARYAGPECTQADNREKLLKELSGVQDRKATFRCVLTLFSPDESSVAASRLGVTAEMLDTEDGSTLQVEGALHGAIAEAERGSAGFGYDSLFEVQGAEGKTLAELKEHGAAPRTHRARAFAALAEALGL